MAISIFNVEIGLATHTLLAAKREPKDYFVTPDVGEEASTALHDVREELADSQDPLETGGPKDHFAVQTIA